MSTKEYFPTVGKIKFEGKESKNPFRFGTTMPKKWCMEEK